MNFLRFSVLVMALSIGSFALADNTDPFDPASKKGFPELLCQKAGLQSDTVLFLYLNGHLGVVGSSSADAKVPQALATCAKSPASQECWSGAAAKRYNPSVQTMSVITYSSVAKNGIATEGLGVGVNVKGVQDVVVVTNAGSFLGDIFAHVELKSAGEEVWLEFVCKAVRK